MISKEIKDKICELQAMKIDIAILVWYETGSDWSAEVL